MPPLKNLRQEMFCLEYVKDADKARAYRAAGYKPMTANSCAALVSQLLRNVNVKRRLGELRERLATRVEVSAARVINELGRIAFSDPRKVIGLNGQITNPQDWDDDTAGAVAGLEVEKLFEGKGKDREFIGYTQKLKLWDKNTALGNLAKHFNLLHDASPLEGLFAGSNIQINLYMPTKGDHARSNGHATETPILLNGGAS